MNQDFWRWRIDYTLDLCPRARLRGVGPRYDYREGSQGARGLVRQVQNRFSDRNELSGVRKTQIHMILPLPCHYSKKKTARFVR